MSWTENEQRLRSIFDRALRLRDAGKHSEAIGALDVLITQLGENDRRLRLHSYLQKGLLADRLGDRDLCEQSFRIAVETSPRSELASMGLFNALFEKGHIGSALEEVVRYVTDHDSDEYRRMLSEGFGEDLSADNHQLATRARNLLARHEKRET